MDSDDGTQAFGELGEGFGGHANWYTPEWRAEMERKYGKPSPYGVGTCETADDQAYSD